MSVIDTFALDDQQHCAATTLDRDVALAAGAGSGKTRTLVARYLHLLEQGLAPGEIAAITFTEKAAREMRSRIRAEIQTLRRNAAADRQAHWSDIEADIDAAPISTFHGLCVRILRAHSAEAGIDPKFSVLDEGQSAVLKARAAVDALTWAVDQESLPGLFHVFTPDALAEAVGILFGQRLEVQAATADDMSRRWQSAISARLHAFAERPATRAAVQQLSSLTGRALVDDAGDKLAAQVEGFRAQWDLLTLELAAGETVAAAQALFRLRRDVMSLSAGKKTSVVKGALRELQGDYDELIDPWLGGKGAQDPAPDPAVEQAAAQSLAALLMVFANALKRYEDQKREKTALDFDDLEGMASRLLEDGTIRGRWQTQLKALLVDEFQDTNERQRQIVNALAGFADGASGRLFVVGDAKQSIYRFRGADVTVFQHLTRDIEARGGLSMALDRTYRAHQGLVAALNEMLGALMGARRPSQPFAVAFASLTAVRPEPRAGIRTPFVEFLCGLGDSAAEARPAGARLLARRLLELRAQNVAWDDVALLFRASSGFAAYEDALDQAGIPFVTVAGRGFYDRPEIRDLLNILRALANPWDDLAIAGMLRSPAFGLSDEALYRLRWAEGKEAPRSFRAALRGELSDLTADDRRQAERARDLLARLAAQVDRIPVAELLKAVLDETLYPAVLSTAGSRLQRNSEKLLADAHASGFIRVNEFLEYVETLNAAGAREGESPAEAEGAVRLLTVHRAKGLQFPVLVIADASRAAPNFAEPVLLSGELGLVPNRGRLAQAPLAYALAKAADKAMAAAEDLRLVYVAATRAQEKVIICGHQLHKGSDVWLKKLIEAADSTVNDLVAAQGQRQTFALPVSGESVGMLSAAAVEPSAVPASASSAPAPLPPLSQTLYASLATDTNDVARAAEGNEDGAEPVEPWRLIMPGDGTLEGTVVGSLVHLAVRRWVFPGDPRYGPLVETMALNAGFADANERARYLARVAELLERLQADNRWNELDHAERHHEVPYMISARRGALTGYLDLLYRKPNGVWQIVDFKTDALARIEEAVQLVRGKYGRQLRRYQEDSRQLLAEPVEAEICFLDVTNAICWKTVDAASPNP